MGKDGTRTRERIIDKSLELFSVTGYHNTSISDILAAAKLTKGGFYGHFASKEELWGAAYEKAVEVWKKIVFKGVREIPDPVVRIARVIENDLFDYVGAGIFPGGCFFLNTLVELAGQSEAMTNRIRKGFGEFAALLPFWLEEADRKGILRPGLEFREIAEFIVVSVNGAAALYAATRERRFLEETSRQLQVYLSGLRV